MIEQTALVTGGSQGIGKAIAIDLAKNGYRVIVTARNSNLLSKVCDEILQTGGNADYISADIGTEDGIKKINDYIEKLSNIEVLVNNAAVIHKSTDLIDFNMADWERVIEVNLLGSVKVTKAVLPSMIKASYGKIVNISSIGGRKGARGRSAYRVTKASLISFTESLAAEVKEHGIDVNCICPGSVITEGYIEAFGKESLSNPNMMEPIEIAKLCTFLVSTDSTSITGAVIDAYGKSNPLFQS
ncbi:MAG: hypothetical protein CL887_04740 [Dehalococcoidia bacterium]|nr:hypothetical protein [Chloroflexota bacterium]MBR97785.1 hypothetical protein [Dehalococcoidia bacterium]|tara:strand:+ start:6620 stop:7348 length:729 start_codon:yes stop_codon:yes gene_type:complete